VAEGTWVPRINGNESKKMGVGKEITGEKVRE